MPVTLDTPISNAEDLFALLSAMPDRKSVRVQNGNGEDFGSVSFQLNPAAGADRSLQFWLSEKYM